MEATFANLLGKECQGCHEARRHKAAPNYVLNFPERLSTSSHVFSWQAVVCWARCVFLQTTLAHEFKMKEFETRCPPCSQSLKIGVLATSSENIILADKFSFDFSMWIICVCGVPKPKIKFPNFVRRYAWRNSCLFFFLPIVFLQCHTDLYDCSVIICFTFKFIYRKILVVSTCHRSVFPDFSHAWIPEIPKHATSRSQVSNQNVMNYYLY